MSILNEECLLFRTINIRLMTFMYVLTKEDWFAKKVSLLLGVIYFESVCTEYMQMDNCLE